MKKRIRIRKFAREIKNLLLFIFYLPIIFFFKLKKSNNYKNSIAVIKTDNIGDYVLFRNFIPYLKKSYPNKDLIFVGNSPVKSFIETFDSKQIDESIYFDKKKFMSSFLYKIKTLDKLSKINVDILVVPLLTREFFVSDIVSSVINARVKIANDTMDYYMVNFLQKFSKKYIYNQIIPTSKDVVFEFYRNKEFFERLVNQPLNIDSPVLMLEKGERFIKDEYFLLFIGASEKFKRWDFENFIKLSELIYKEYKIKSVFCGASSDIGQPLTKYKLPNSITNLIGKTSLSQLSYYIKDAKLLVTNDTLAQHLGVALKTSCLTISNGSDYKRFTPYPDSISKSYEVVFPDEFDLVSEETRLKTYGFYRSKLNINNISVEKVFSKVRAIL